MADKNNKNNDFEIVEDAVNTSIELEVGGASKKSYFHKIKLVPIVFGVIFISLVFVAYTYYQSWQFGSKRFPHLPTGSYLGEMRNIFPHDADKVTRFYIEQSDESHSLFFVILRDGWKPQLFNTAASSEENADGSWLFPITILAPEGKLRFVGDAHTDGTYTGIVYDMDNKNKGQWSLAALSPESVDRDPQARSESKLWLLLKSELEEVEAKITQAESHAPKQKQEISKLNKYVTEGDELKAKAQDKFNQAVVQLDQAQKAFKAKQEEALSLAHSLELSEKVTGTGKLVSLARETMEREVRWVETLDRSNLPSDQQEDEFDQNYQAAKVIMDLKQKIAIEKDHIYRLTNSSAAKKSLEINNVD